MYEVAVVTAIALIVLSPLLLMFGYSVWKRAEVVRGVEQLELYVKDIEEAPRHKEIGAKYCRKCGGPLRVYAMHEGFDSATSEARYRKFSRCERWRWYRGGGHCRKAKLYVSPDIWAGEYDYEV